MPRWIARQRKSMRVTPLGFCRRVIVIEKPLNLEKRTSSVLSVLLLIYDKPFRLKSHAKLAWPKFVCRLYQSHLKKPFKPHQTLRYEPYFLNFKTWNLKNPHYIWWMKTDWKVKADWLLNQYIWISVNKNKYKSGLYTTLHVHSFVYLSEGCAKSMSILTRVGFNQFINQSINQSINPLIHQ